MGEAKRRGSREERIEQAQRAAERSTDAVIFVGMMNYNIGVSTVVQTWDNCVRPAIRWVAERPEQETREVMAYMEVLLPKLDREFTEAFDAQEQPDFGGTNIVVKHGDGQTESFSWKGFCDMCVDYAVCRLVVDGIPIPLIRPETMNEHLAIGRFSDETVEKAANDDMVKIADVTATIQ